jgi:hypothetical protein
MRQISREEILDTLRTAPPPGHEKRAWHIGNKCGQLVGWLTTDDAKFLIDWLPEVGLSYGKPMQIVEVGTFAGSTARGLICLSGGGNITCIDNFLDMNAATLGGRPSGRAYWEETVGSHPDLLPYATLLEGESSEIGKAWNKPIDLLFVDGDHSYEGATSDLTLFAKHIVAGGYLMVDDCHMPAVQKAVCDYLPGCWDSIRNANLSVFRRQ